MDLDEEDIKEPENSKDENTAQAVIQIADTIWHTVLLNISHTITRRMLSQTLLQTISISIGSSREGNSMITMASCKEEKARASPGGDGVETLKSGMSDKDNLQQAEATNVFFMPMPLLATYGSLIFEGPNVTEFLECYEDLCTDYWVSEEDKLVHLPWYYIRSIADTVKSLREWKAQDYLALKKALLAKYKNEDSQHLLYLVSSLEKYKNISRMESDDILDYCHTFDRITQYCIEKEVLMKYTASIWFIHGLPPVVASSLI